MGVQPDRTGGGLPHLLALGIHQKGDGHCIGVLSQLPPDELRSPQHIGPLVIAAELHIASIFLEEMVEVIGLHNHVVKFQEGQALLHPLLIALSPEHVVDRETGTHVTEKINVIELQEPIGIVDHNGLSLSEIDEPLHLLFEAVTVVLDGFRGHHGTHIGAPRRISDISGAAAHQNHGTVARHLQTLHQAQRHKVPHMQAVRCGIESNVKRGLSCVDQLSDFLFIRHLGD